MNLQTRHDLERAEDLVKPELHRIKPRRNADIHDQEMHVHTRWILMIRNEKASNIGMTGKLDHVSQRCRSYP